MAIGITVPTSWTQNASTGYTLPTNGAQGAYRATGETITTVTYTVASSNYGIVAVEVNADSTKASAEPIFGSEMACGSGVIGLDRSH